MFNNECMHASTMVCVESLEGNEKLQRILTIRFLVLGKRSFQKLEQTIAENLKFIQIN
jgi:hypothetical protein